MSKKFCWIKKIYLFNQSTTESHYYFFPCNANSTSIGQSIEWKKYDVKLRYLDDREKRKPNYTSESVAVWLFAYRSNSEISILFANLPWRFNICRPIWPNSRANLVHERITQKLNFIFRAADGGRRLGILQKETSRVLRRKNNLPERIFIYDRSFFFFFLLIYDSFRQANFAFTSGTLEICTSKIVNLQKQ